MSVRTLKLKWIHLPLGIAISATALTLAAGHHSSKPDITINQGTNAEVGAALNSEEPKVTINGETVGGNGQFQVGGATVNVSGNSTTVQSGGGSTTVVNDEGGIDVHVESNTSTSGSSSHVITTGGGTFTFSTSDNGFSVFQSGEGNISVSN